MKIRTATRTPTRPQTKEPFACRRLGGRGRVGPLLAAMLAAGCAADVAPQPVAVADVTELMISVLEPAAETYWEGVGEILVEDGVHQIRPQSDEDWAALRNAAFVIAESGNLLMMDGRVRDRSDWMTYSSLMVDAGRVALAAADRRDAAAVFDAGAEVYYACRDCHARYATETLRPSDPSSVISTALGTSAAADTAPVSATTDDRTDGEGDR